MSDENPSPEELERGRQWFEDYWSMWHSGQGPATTQHFLRMPGRLLDRPAVRPHALREHRSWIFAGAPQDERPEVFVPVSIRRIRFGFHPSLPVGEDRRVKCDALRRAVGAVAKGRAED